MDRADAHNGHSASVRHLRRVARTVRVFQPHPGIPSPTPALYYLHCFCPRSSSTDTCIMHYTTITLQVFGVIRVSKRLAGAWAVMLAVLKIVTGRPHRQPAEHTLRP